MAERTKILLFPITNEVIPGRVFGPLLSLAKDYEIVGFAARPSKDKIQERLNNEIIRRENYRSDWRTSQTQEEITNLYLMKDMIKNGFPYFQIDSENNELPDEAYNITDCVFIGTNNLTHIGYCLDTYKHGKSFIVEKPFVVNREDLEVAKNLETLIEYEKSKGNNLTGKITAHFSHKPACLTLFESIDDLITEYGKIKKFSGYYEEKDDPDKPRTRATLDIRTSGGGIYLDTGCHIEMILSILGATVQSTNSFEWDSYPGYGVETYCRVVHSISGARFSSDNSTAEIVVGKFVDRYRQQPSLERKEIHLEFENNQRAICYLSSGEIKIFNNNRNKNKLINTLKSSKYPSKEYTSVLKDFRECVINKKEPLTNLRRGIESSETIIRDYEQFRNGNNRKEKY